MKRNSGRATQFLKVLLQRIRLRYLAHIDVARFSRTANFSTYDSGYEQVVSRIMYNVHALEKGLARTHDQRLNFGRKALSNLNDAMAMYVEQNFDTLSFAYEQGVAVIQRYIEHHHVNGVDANVVEEVVDPRFAHPASQTLNVAGTKVIKGAEKSLNHLKNFYDLSQARSSVREFSGDPIETGKVLRALTNAMKAPSVCNRQGWRAYWVDSPRLARQVLAHQRGYGYPQMPEVLLTVAVSNTTFLSPVERNEAFVDGGLFAMSILYGLEHEGLAAVPLNAMMYARDQRAVRRLLKIDDSEMITMFIAVGSFPDRTVVPVSDRKPLESVIRYRGEEHHPNA